jgi:Protein of unknown function (DUF3187)
MRPRATLWLALLLPGLAFGSELDDPLPIRDPFPLKLLFLDQPPSGATLQPPLRARLSINASYVNTMVATDDLVELYNRDPSLRGIVTLGVLQMVANAQASRTAFIFDGETLRTTLQARVGVTQRFELGVDAPFLSQYRGFVDPFIDEFHHRFNLPDGGRTGFAHNQFRAGYIGDGATVYFDAAPGGVRLGDVVLSAAGALLVESHRSPAVSLTLSAKLPTGDYRSLDGSGSFDYGGTLRLSKRWGRSTAHAGYSFNSVGEWRLAPTLGLHNSRSLFGAYSFSATPDTSLILQVLRTAGPFPFRSGNDLGKVAMEVAAGFRHRMAPDFELEWSFIENIDPYYNTPDIGAFLGVNYHTGRAPASPAGRRDPSSR